MCEDIYTYVNADMYLYMCSICLYTYMCVTQIRMAPSPQRSPESPERSWGSAPRRCDPGRRRCPEQCSMQSAPHGIAGAGPNTKSTTFESHNHGFCWFPTRKLCGTYNNDMMALVVSGTHLLLLLLLQPLQDPMDMTCFIVLRGPQTLLLLVLRGAVPPVQRLVRELSMRWPTPSCQHTQRQRRHPLAIHGMSRLSRQEGH